MRAAGWLCVLALIGGGLPDGAGAGERWLELTPPGGSGVLRGPAWVEVRGRARERREGVPYDLVIALDLSESSFRPAGFDVDGDGRIGALRQRFMRVELTDRHDSVAHAGLRLARQLVDRVDPSRGRVALITFAGTTQLRSPLDRPERTAERLAELALYARRDGTHLAAAIHRSMRVLDSGEPGPGGATPERAILLLSDGYPTAPGSRQSAARYALYAALEAGRRATPVFGVSPERASGPVPPTLEQMASRSGGQVFRTAWPEDWLRRLEPQRALEVRHAALVNLRTGAPGRAVRWFDDGSFDGYVELEPGVNRIEIRAQLADGETLVDELVLRYAGVKPQGTDALLQALRRRTLETQLAREAGTVPEPRRSVVVESE